MVMAAHDIMKKVGKATLPSSNFMDFLLQRIFESTNSKLTSIQAIDGRRHVTYKNVKNILLR
jgi:hypothetical protein